MKYGSLAVIKKIKNYFKAVNFDNKQPLSLPSRIVRGSAHNFIASVFTQGSSFIATIIVARLLSKQVFGIYAMGLSTLLTISSLAQLAMGYTATKYVAEFRSKDPLKTGRILGLCSVVNTAMALFGAILFLLSSSSLATNILKAPELAMGFILGTGFLFFSTINGYQAGALAGLEGYRELAVASVISGVIAICGIGIGVWLGGLNGVFLALSITTLLRWYFYNIFLAKVLRTQGICVSREGLYREKNIVFKFALPAILSGYYSMPILWLANSFLVRQAGGYAEMALYAAALNIKTLALFIPNVINTVMSSVLNHLRSNDNRQRYDRLFILNVTFIFFITLVTVLILVSFGSGFLRIFGKDFTAGRPVLLILLLAAIFEATAIAIYQRIQNEGRMWLSFVFLNLPTGPLFLTVAFLLIPSLGAIGLGIANAVMALFSLLGAATVVNYLNKREKAIMIASAL